MCEDMSLYIKKNKPKSSGRSRRRYSIASGSSSQMSAGFYDRSSRTKASRPQFASGGHSALNIKYVRFIYMYV